MISSAANQKAWMHGSDHNQRLTVYPEYTILPSCKSKHEVRINQTEKTTLKYMHTVACLLVVYCVKTFSWIFFKPEKFNCRLYLRVLVVSTENCHIHHIVIAGLKEQCQYLRIFSAHANLKNYCRSFSSLSIQYGGLSRRLARR